MKSTLIMKLGREVEESNEEECVLNQEVEESHKENKLSHGDDIFFQVRKRATSAQDITARKTTLRVKHMLNPFIVGQNATLKIPEIF